MPTSPSGWTPYGSPVLTDKLRAFLDRLAARLGRRLVVTSGVRTPESQAQAMLKKKQAGEDLHDLYAQDSLVDELFAVPETLEDWTAVLQSQVDRGFYISDHMRGDAIDIDDYDASGKQLDKGAVFAAAEAEGVEVRFESILSHYHFEEIT